jgi:hypothetical protein
MDIHITWTSQKILACNFAYKSLISAALPLFDGALFTWKKC